MWPIPKIPDHNSDPLSGLWCSMNDPFLVQYPCRVLAHLHRETRQARPEINIINNQRIFIKWHIIHAFPKFINGEIYIALKSVNISTRNMKQPVRLCAESEHIRLTYG